MRFTLTVTTLFVAAFGLLTGPDCLAQSSKAALDKPIPRGAKVFIAPVEGGFENYLAAGLQKKQVPVVVVGKREMAEYEMSGVAESEKAGWAKMLFMGTTASKEQAGIKVMNIQTQEVVFAYAVHKSNSARGKQSAAEACAKHLKEKIESK
ncbi:MAG: hypothetical protein HYR60_28935 [Acidobacteria bacterium]|nr:hypothetical protein [Acidobacteriota bacterium]MBI3472124.1 hypothetical protein [Candidatus Solibacter usitatus]MBI3645470.1 hypothetical protein [Terriglobales bacterium]